MKGRINLNISGSKTYDELCQIHRTSSASKTLVVKIVSLTTKMVPALVVTNAYIAAVAHFLNSDWPIVQVISRRTTWVQI